jgi:hypothetical protein
MNVPQQLPGVPGTGLDEHPPHAAGGAPVFTDLSGRRMRRMRLAGLAAAGMLLACLAVMAAGLLGGPRASFVPWDTLNPASSPARPHTGGSPGRPAAPAIPPVPGPAPLREPQASAGARPSAAAGPSAAATPAASGAATASPSPSATNVAGKTPPGRNRSPSPHPSPGHTRAA